MIHKDLVTLKQITAPILDDIKIFQQEFENALKSEVRLINSISKYMVRNRGKNIRPILTILSARLCGEPTLNSYRAAAMMELLHIATLIHDDVVDDATLRRGKPSINKVWKNKISVLMGDFILSKALINIIGIRDFDALEKISNTAEKLSAGEILQIEKSITKSMTEDVYFDMINQKTASLIATSCELGAITTTKKDQDRSATFKYGDNLGIAFQIKDDLFDLLGKESDTGKNSGTDVKKNMMTLPLIFSYANMTRLENRQLKKLMGLKNKTRKNLIDIRGMVSVAGGFDYARKKLDDFSNNALDAIAIYPNSPVKQSLSDLVAFNAYRVK
ncbi:MAG: polyprenyl synthetase family protein [Candidatus Marinimicrobia bacterium]|jgi:octaprenyl-diphosphate synthase|nr:polyprenyl synthetase family protein [Candidatus Neomarinimicrobiota bacterium]MBT5461004.1 polyprenyl synthetase family protein [Candidatus Neomarinimicrobiota bacterium]